MINMPKRKPGRNLAASLLTGVLLIMSGCQAGPAAHTETTPAATTAPAAAILPITPEAARQMLQDDPAVVLLDVRTADEYAAGHIAGSRLLPYDEIKTRTGELPADKATPIIVYCRTGRRSALAAASLAELGYTRIYDLGGIQSWPYETVAP